MELVIRVRVENYEAGMNRVAGATKKAKPAVDALRSSLGATSATMDQIAAAQYQRDIEKQVKAWKKLLGATAPTDAALRKLAIREREVATAQRKAAAATRARTVALQRQRDAMRNLVGAFGVGFGAVVIVRGISQIIGAAVEYEDALIRINTLVGVQMSRVRQWSEELRRLAPELGRGPAELAQALFVVTSAGIRDQAEAIEVLTQAGKAAAIGLGDTAEIARAATAAIQAYGSSNLSAEEAVNVLLETVREGNLVTEELVPVIGRVIGIGEEMGIEFGELGANIATYTRLGIKADEATTGLRRTLLTFLAPARETRDALRSMGLGVDQIRKKIREDGLAETLIFLNQALKGNLDTLGHLIPNVRATANFLGVAGEQAESYRHISELLTDDTIELAKAFEFLKKESPGQALREAKADVENLKVEIGTGLIPVWRELLTAIRNVATGLQDLGTLRRLAQRDPISPQHFIDFLGLGKEFANLQNTLDRSKKHWDDYFSAVGRANEDLSSVLEAQHDAIQKSLVATEVLAQSSMSLADAMKLIKEVELAAAIEKQVETWNQLIGAGTVGEDVLRKLARQQIQAAEAAKTHREALAKERERLREAREAAKSLAKAIDQVAEARKKAASLQNLQFIGEFDPALAAAQRQLAEAFDEARLARLDERKKLLLEIETIQEASIRIEREVNELILTGTLSLEEGRKLLAQRLETLNDTKDKAAEASDEFDRWIELGSQFASILGNMDSDAGRFLQTVTQIASGLKAAKTAAGGLEGALAGLSVGAGVGGLIGGSAESQVGGAFGGAIAGLAGFGPWGILAASVIGAFAGDLFSDKVITEATVLIERHRGRFETALSTWKGEVAGLAQAFGDGVIAGLEAVASTFGAAVQDFSIEAAISKEGDAFRVVLQGGLERLFANLQDAQAFAVAQAVREGAISGLSPEAEALLSSWAIDTQGEFQQAMALAVSLETDRLGEAEVRIRNAVAGLFERTVAAIEGGVPVDLAIQSLVGGLSSLRDQITGTTRSARELFEEQRVIFNAELALRKAELALMLAELEAREASINQRRGAIPVLTQMTNAGRQVRGSLQGATASMGALSQGAVIAGRGAVAGATAVAGFGNTAVAAGSAMAAATTTLSAALAEALAALDAIQPISPGEFRVPSLGDGGLAGRQQERAALEDLLRAQERLAAGYDETTLRGLEFEDQLNALRERAQAAAWSTERLNLLIELMTAQFEEAELARELEEAAREAEEAAAAAAKWAAELQAARDAVADFAGQGGVASQIQGVIDRAQALADAFSEIPTMTGFAEEFATIAGALQSQVQALAAGFLTGILEAELRRQIELTTGVADRRALEEELFNLQRNRQQLERDFQFAQLALIEAQLTALGAMTEGIAVMIARTRELLAEPLPEFADTVVQAGQDFADTVGSNDPQSAAQQFLDSLADALGSAQAGNDPLAEIRAEMDSLREQAFEFRHIFFLLGTTYEDVLADIQELEDLRIAEAWRAATEDLRDFIGELTGGSLSGLTSLEQAQVAQAEFNDLLARAQVGDILAVQELAARGRSLIDLAAPALGFAGEANLRQQLIDVLGPIANQGGAPTTGDVVLQGLDALDLAQEARDNAAFRQRSEMIRLMLPIGRPKLAERAFEKRFIVPSVTPGGGVDPKPIDRSKKI